MRRSSWKEIASANAWRLVAPQCVWTQFRLEQIEEANRAKHRKEVRDSCCCFWDWYFHVSWRHVQKEGVENLKIPARQSGGLLASKSKRHKYGR